MSCSLPTGTGGSTDRARSVSAPPNRAKPSGSLALILAAVLSLSAIPASAITWYTVEVIAFKRAGDAALQAEIWPADPGRPDVLGAVSLTSGPSDGSRGFELLESSRLKLRDVAARLRRSEAYQPLLHIAWRQPGYTRGRARTVHIHSRLPNPYQSAGDIGVIDGTLRLSRARYLHLDTDLLYFRSDPDRASLGFSVPSQASVFRMREDRRMRSSELHYLDHPMFGLLVLVTPNSPAAPEASGAPNDPPAPAE